MLYDLHEFPEVNDCVIVTFYAKITLKSALQTFSWS